MSSITDILASKNFDEPPEIQIIKQYVKDNYSEDVSVEIRSDQIIIVVPNAALAGTLRLESHKLAELCQTKKRLVLRIGH